MTTSIMTTSWTEEHDQFCLQLKIPPAAKLLWQWLIRQGLEDEIEPDLSEFNQWVEKHRGKKYAHNYLKQMFQKLIDCRVVRIAKKFSWKIYRLIVRPLSWLKPRRKQKLQNQEQTYKIQPSNLTKTVEEKSIISTFLEATPKVPLPLAESR